LKASGKLLFLQNTEKENVQFEVNKSPKFTKKSPVSFMEVDH